MATETVIEGAEETEEKNIIENTGTALPVSAIGNEGGKNLKWLSRLF